MKKRTLSGTSRCYRITLNPDERLFSEIVGGRLHRDTKAQPEISPAAPIHPPRIEIPPRHLLSLPQPTDQPE